MNAPENYFLELAHFEKIVANVSSFAKDQKLAPPAEKELLARVLALAARMAQERLKRIEFFKRHGWERTESGWRKKADAHSLP